MERQKNYIWTTVVVAKRIKKYSIKGEKGP